MSLDITLTNADGEEVYEANITHNLNKMADAAGIYYAMWRPDEIGIERAGDLIPLLIDGIAKLTVEPMKYKQFDAANGWGTYEQFVPFASQYLTACIKFPEAIISVSR